ncbi:hypothetical protein D3C81_979690 [compost metagenome]
MLGQVEHMAEHVDVAHQQHALAIEPGGNRGGRRIEHGEHVLGVVLHVLIEIVKQRTFVEGAVPLAMPLEKLLRGQPRSALPGRHVRAACRQEALHAQHHAIRPDHFLGADRQHIVDIAAQVEARAQCADHAQRKLGAHPVQGRGSRHAGRGTQERRAVVFSKTGEVHGHSLRLGWRRPDRGGATCTRLPMFVTLLSRCFLPS